MFQPTKLLVGLITVLAMVFITACDWFDPGRTKSGYAKHGVYELDMQVYIKGLSYSAREDENLIRQWRLNIPRPFIYSHRGVNGKPNYNPIKDKSNKYSMTLFAAIDVDNEKIVEQEKFGWPTDGEKRVTLRLSNGRPIEKFRSKKNA